MRKSKKTIIYMLVALFVAVSTVLVDFNTSYAQTSYSDVPDADWKYFVAGNTANTALNKGERDTPSKPLPDGRPTDFVSITNCQYVENLAYYNVKSDYSVGVNVSIASDTEIVLVLDYVHAVPGYQAGTLNLFALSKSRMYFAKKGNWYCDGAWKDHGSVGKIDFTTNEYANSDYQYYKILNAWTESSSDALEYGFMTGKMKVFSTADDAMNYLETGDTSKMAWQGSEPKQTYNKDAKLESFKMNLHRSNDINKYYVDFSYSLPNDLLGKGYSLKFEQVYRNEVGTGEVGAVHTSKDYSDSQYVVLSDNPFSCRLYLKDFNSLKASFSDMLDRFNIHVLDGKYDSVYSEWLGIVPGFSSGDITMSILYLNVWLTNSTDNGYVYKCAINLLNGDNYVEPYEPAEDGTYSKAGDRETNGSYYTKVSVDGAGNTTYNYYYYYPDGDRKEVSSDDAANNTLSNTIQSGAIQNNNSPVFNNNNTITIEGDTITNEANNYASSNSSSSDNESFLSKFLGFFELLKNNKFLTVFSLVFGWLPPEVSVVITSAIGIICVIGVFKFLRR